MRLGSWLAFTLAWVWIHLGTEPKPVDSPAARLVLLDRQISQRNSHWLVRYQVRYDGDQALELSASELSLEYDGWVANSRCRPHTVPRRSQIHFTLAESSSVLVNVIASANDRLRCRERVSLAVAFGNEPANEPPPAKTNFLPIRLSPGQVFWLFLILDHDHFLYGTYDPLLGERNVEIRLGPCRLIDSIPLDAEQGSAMPQVRLSAPPKERLDSRQFHSAPDSLYLAADVPGYQYFRFDDMPVRYGTRFRVSFWYLTAVGTEGTCRVRVMEYQDTPNAWYRLDGGLDEELPAQGTWTYFEQTFRALGDTTTMALDFRIVGANVGELWIDDAELVPLYAESCKP